MAATYTFKLSWPGGSLDLSSYVRVNPDDPNPMDPYSPHFVEPAFSQTPYSDGQVLTSVTVNNREQQWPLYVKDPTYTKDALHSLIRQINSACNQRPLTLEWRDDGASKSTYYDVPFARFEPSYNFRRSQHGYAAGVLHVWTSGYGHTGTTRVAATAAGTGIFLSVPIGSVAGDAPALLTSVITAGAFQPSIGRIVAVAPITQPSYVPRVPAASLTDLPVGATLVGASGADGSQYLALPVSPTGGAAGIVCNVPLPNPTIAGGDNRILAVVKSGIDSGVGLYAVDPYGNLLGGTAVASMSQAFGVLDLGVCRLPTTGYPTLPKISIYAGGIWASGAPGPGIISSPAGLALNEVLVLPDKNLALAYERADILAVPGIPGAILSQDVFSRSGYLNNLPDSLGQIWSEAYNFQYTAVGILQEQNGYVTLPITASALDGSHLAQVLAPNMQIQARALFQGKGGAVFVGKEATAGYYVAAGVGIQPNASYAFSLYGASNGNANLTVIACQALATLSLNQRYTLTLNVNGFAGYVNLTRDDGGPVFTPGSAALASVGVASNALLGALGPGVPALWVGNPSNAFPQPNIPHVYQWEVDSAAVQATTLATAFNLQPYDSYTLDGVAHDSYRVASGGAFFAHKLTSVQHGAHPKLSPSTVSLAVVCAPVGQGPANDLISAAISVRERFSYGQ